jgi:hypothetical protein
MAGFGLPAPCALRGQLSGLMVIRKREFGPTLGELGPNSLEFRAPPRYSLSQGPGDRRAKAKPMTNSGGERDANLPCQPA